MRSNMLQEALHAFTDSVTVAVTVIGTCPGAGTVAITVAVVGTGAGTLTGTGTLTGAGTGVVSLTVTGTGTVAITKIQADKGGDVDSTTSPKLPAPKSPDLKEKTAEPTVTTTTGKDAPQQSTEKSDSSNGHVALHVVLLIGTMALISVVR